MFSAHGARIDCSVAGFPDEHGEPIARAGSFLIGHENPLSERWGGWYVTGRHGLARHMGNVLARERGNDADLDRDAGANVTNLARFFPTDRYLGGNSDIVALMGLEHQVGMHSRLVEGALRVRKWLHYQQQLQQELGEPVSAEPTGTALRVIEGEAQRILEYLVFADELPLPEGGVQGAAQLQEALDQNRHPDSKGRSLEDFDLRTRLFAHRCSYMIYAPAFDSLPAPLQTTIYRKLRDGLTSAQPPKPFAHLSAAERQAIREILVTTKPGLATAWQAMAGN